MKVVCIAKPVENWNWPGEINAIVDHIYTIRAIRLTVRRPQYGVALLFDEIHNSISDFHNREPAFYSCRFRPVVSKQTDISCFQKLLNPTPEKVRVSIISDTLADIYFGAAK